MPDQNQNSKSLIILAILAAIAATVFVVLRQMPGKFQNFEYEKVFEPQTVKEAKTGKVTDRISLEGFHPRLFSTGQWQAQTAFAVANSDKIRIIDTKGTITTTIPIDTRPSAIKLIGPPDAPRLITTIDNKLQIIDLQSKKVIFAINIPNDKALITSLTTTDNYIYAADAEDRSIWQINLPLNSNLLDYDPDAATICPIGNKQFVLPSAHFEVRTDLNNTDIWASNTGKHLLEKYAPDVAEPIESWGHPSFKADGFAGCCNPASFTILSDGRFVTVEKGSTLIKLFSATGDYLGLIADRLDFERPEAFKTLIFPLVDSTSTLPDTIFILDTTCESIIIFDIE